MTRRHAIRAAFGLGGVLMAARSEAGEEFNVVLSIAVTRAEVSRGVSVLETKADSVRASCLKAMQAEVARLGWA